MLVLVVVSVVAIAKNGGHLSAAPFQWSNMTNGFRGLAAGFPLAVYLFIGWENSAALAGETGNPRRNVPRAVFLSIAMMGVGYVLFAYATLTGFHYNAPYYLTKPGQSQPYNWFPYAALAIVVVAVVYSIFLSRRDPGLGDRVGSIIADE
jgi:amino acid transporter